MNKTQIQTIIAPLVGVAASWLATKLPFIDSATWSVWINSIITAGVLTFIAYITGNTSLISQAAALPEVKSVKLEQTASDATVDATPANVTK